MMYHQLTHEERYLISTGIALGLSIRTIAAHCNRSPGTISREVRRNATTHDGIYRAEKAQSYATARRRRCRRGTQFSDQIHAAVVAALKERWSPEQIVGAFREEGRIVPSHETIYRHIRRDRRTGGTLYRFTRIMSKTGRKRYRSRPARGVLFGKRHISERPKVVDRRSRIGDWEGDTVIGKHSKHCLLTLTERRSGLAIICKLKARTAAEVIRALREVIRQAPHRFKTITFDNGTEFHSYRELELEFGLKCYFATPYHSWERGSNENLNGLIRQYLPKGKCFRRISQTQCDVIAHALNTRPRKRHCFKTPLSIYNRSA